MNLKEIKGIGLKTAQLLEHLGIYNSDDLIAYYPYRYNLIKRSDLATLTQDSPVIIDGIVENIPSLFHFNRKMDKMTFRINTGSQLLTVTIFNRGYLKNKILPNTTVTIFGKYDKMHSSIMANDMRFSLLGDQEIIEPVYHITSGISSKQLRNYVNAALPTVETFKDYIPDYLIEKYNFLNRKESVINIHNPNDKDILSRAVKALKYEELFIFMQKMYYLKNNYEHQLGLSRVVDYQKVEQLINSLTFTLTNDQNEVIKQIYDDLISNKRMNRLLQGDVGSGKTIVAFISMYINYLSGYQSAMMVPTDVLAGQHFLSIQKLFANFNIKIGLLTGSLKAKDKKAMQLAIASGEIDMVIGTHALISDTVNYHNLGLVITDEQHRFGVNQRSNLKNKGKTPDILYMSATPIPRTYALTIYGDMEVSTIKTMPKGRKEIMTSIKTNNDIKDVLTMMYEELKNNHQIYVIAPLISESDKIELENIGNLEEKMQKAFGKLFKIGTMHGQMTNEEKDVIMQKFTNNEVNILISTTVIEVGVDVPNATMIVIFDSYRFGLSTLHQLRGRVGRSDLQSYCILISDYEKERLNILTKTSDGFVISEEDFKLRGSGDLFGVRQSGEAIFKIADIHNDYDLLLQAKDDVYEYLKSSVNKKQ